YEGHLESSFIVEDTGLGIQRTKNVVIVTVFSRPRTQEAKQAFYSDLCQELETSCDINPSDVVVCVVPNTDSDWSFGIGRAQFITENCNHTTLRSTRS